MIPYDSPTPATIESNNKRIEKGVELNYLSLENPAVEYNTKYKSVQEDMIKATQGLVEKGMIPNVVVGDGEGNRLQAGPYDPTLLHLKDAACNPIVANCAEGSFENKPVPKPVVDTGEDERRRKELF